MNVMGRLQKTLLLLLLPQPLMQNNSLHWNNANG
jgi:hypothetical protein